MKIRKYQPEDRGKLISLWHNIFPNDPPHNEPSSVIDAKLAVDDLILIAEIEVEIVGACIVGYDGHRGWLYAVGVSSKFRRNGIGGTLVKSALEELKSIGCVKVNLQIRPTNTEVASFYKSMGFKVEDRLSMGALIEKNV